MDIETITSQFESNGIPFPISKDYAVSIIADINSLKCSNRESLIPWHVEYKSKQFHENMERNQRVWEMRHKRKVFQVEYI